MESTNYDQFSFYDDNRIISNGHVQSLIGSINEIGYIKGSSILVDKNYKIIDGQHRFLACQELDLPIHYEVVDLKVDYHKVMIALNKSQSNWKVIDYVRLHAKNHIECYIRLLQFENKFKLGISNSICIVFNGSGNSKKIRSGENIPLNKQREEIAEFILSCKNYLPFWRSSKFVMSIVELYKRAPKEDIAKLEERAMIIKQQANMSSYLQMYENMINKGRQKKLSLVLK